MASPFPTPFPIDRIEDGEDFDVVVIGAGGAGMSAALFAAIDGAKTLLIEATEFVGGTTAYSGGANWLPGNLHGHAVNPADTLDDAARFLDHSVGNLADRAQRMALLHSAAAAVEHLEANSHVRYFARRFQPDYVSEADGSTEGGRALEPVPFDGDRLGLLFGLVRPPIPEYTFIGGMMVDYDDVPHLLAWRRSWTSFKHTVGMVLRHLADRTRHARGARLVLGNALVARLLLSLVDRQVRIMTRSTVAAISAPHGAVDQVILVQDGQRRAIRIRGGVVLASGGFSRHAGRRDSYAPGMDPAWSPSSPGNTGGMHALAEAVGAHYGASGHADFFWTPVSLRKRRDGSTAVYPHFSRDRTKPRMITVGANGCRFANESASWHEFGRAMVEGGVGRTVPSFLITDRTGLRRYGFGMVRPGGGGLRSAIADGYVTSGSTLAELAGKLGIDGAALANTVRKLNAYAESGVDPEFGRGTTSYQRAFGDRNWPGKNPNLGPIDTPPFYAIRLYPGDIGTATGFVTDPHGRALDRTSRPIPGLYVCGNDMHSVMGGVYAGPGITIGPGMVFAYLGARHAATRAREGGTASAGGHEQSIGARPHGEH